MLLLEDIVKDTNPLLREKSVEVQLPLSKEDTATLDKMLEYVRNSQDEKMVLEYKLRPSVGIAAPQVGVLKRMVVLRITYGDCDDVFEFALVNPQIISKSPKLQFLGGGEACLSVLNDYGDKVTPRAAKIRVKAFDYLQGKEVDLQLDDFEAIVFQHEYDHLEGKLFYDNLKTSRELKALGAEEL